MKKKKKQPQGYIKPRTGNRSRLRSNSGIAFMMFDPPTFPVPGQQNCFPMGAPSLTATGPVPALPERITEVQLVIGNMLPISVVPVVAGATWTANFPAATPNVLANTPCRLIVIGRDGTTRRVLSFQFTHTPRPAQLSLNGVPGANHTTVVSGTTKDIGALSLLVDGAVWDPGFDAVAETIVFTTPSTSSPTQALHFVATNDSGESATFDFTLSVDQIAPTFILTPAPAAAPRAAAEFVFRGEVDDPDTDANPASGFNTDGTQFNAIARNSSGSTIPSSIVSTPIDPLRFSYEVTVPVPPPGTYTVVMIATDIAGNQATRSISFTEP